MKELPLLAIALKEQKRLLSKLGKNKDFRQLRVVESMIAEYTNGTPIQEVDVIDLSDLESLEIRGSTQTKGERTTALAKEFIKKKGGPAPMKEIFAYMHQQGWEIKKGGLSAHLSTVPDFEFKQGKGWALKGG